VTSNKLLARGGSPYEAQHLGRHQARLAVYGDRLDVDGAIKAPLVGYARPDWAAGVRLVIRREVVIEPV
jgi:hypothetical protein